MSKSPALPTRKQGARFANKYRLQLRIDQDHCSETWLAESKDARFVIQMFSLPETISRRKWDRICRFEEEQDVDPDIHMLYPVHTGMTKDLPFVVYPYFETGSARQWAGTLRESELITFMYQAVCSLNWLHKSEPIRVHQGLKPEIFLIDSAQNYVMSDIGISGKIRGLLPPNHTGRAEGFAYQAPETFTQPGDYQPSADIFSFGVCLYEMATGRLPLGKEGGRSLLQGGQVPDLPENYSQRFNQIIRLCLARDPKARPTADTLQKLAETYLETARWQSVGGFSFTAPRASETISLEADPNYLQEKDTTIFLLPQKARKPIQWPIRPKWIAAAALGGLMIWAGLNLMPERSEQLAEGPVFAPTPAQEAEDKPVPKTNPEKEALVEDITEISEEAGEEKNEKTIAETPPKDSLWVDFPTKSDANPRTASSGQANPSPDVNLAKQQLASAKPLSRSVKRPYRGVSPQKLDPVVAELNRLLSSTTKLELDLETLMADPARLSMRERAFLMRVNQDLGKLARDMNAYLRFSDTGETEVAGWQPGKRDDAWLGKMLNSIESYQKEITQMRSIASAEINPSD